MNFTSTNTEKWTKVNEVLGQRRRPFVLYNSLTRLSVSRFILQIFAIKSRSRRKTEQMQVLAPNFFPEGWSQFFYGRLLARFTVHCLAKFGWVPFADLRLRSLAMKWNAECTAGGWKLTSNLKPFVDQSSCRFETI